MLELRSLHGFWASVLDEFSTWRVGSDDRFILWSCDRAKIPEVPLADWIPRQGNDSHDALTKLTDEINQDLGRLSAKRWSWQSSELEAFEASS